MGSDGSDNTPASTMKIAMTQASTGLSMKNFAMTDS